MRTPCAWTSEKAPISPELWRSQPSAASSTNGILQKKAATQSPTALLGVAMLTLTLTLLLICRRRPSLCSVGSSRRDSEMPRLCTDVHQHERLVALVYSRLSFPRQRSYN